MILYFTNLFSSTTLIDTTGAVTLSLAATLQPSYNAQGAFLSDATTATEKSAGNAEFLASYGSCFPVTSSAFPCQLFARQRQRRD